MIIWKFKLYILNGLIFYNVNFSLIKLFFFFKIYLCYEWVIGGIVGISDFVFSMFCDYEINFGLEYIWNVVLVFKCGYVDIRVFVDRCVIILFRDFLSSGVRNRVCK